MQMRKYDYKLSAENIRHSIVMSCVPRSSSLPLKGFQTRKSVSGLICHDRSSPNGESASLINAWPDSRKGHGGEDPAFFPPEIIVAVKALACQLPKQLGLPFSRFTHDEIARQVEKQGIVASISGKTVWRWLSKDAIRPWCYQSWIWPRDPAFEQKAGRVLDLYHGIWEGKPLRSHDFVISSDEKTSIQARHRVRPTTAPGAGCYGRVEHEYERGGSLAYMAAWDVRQAKIFGVCKVTTGIDSFHDLVDLVMRQEPYRSARRVFWVTDNGSSHRGQTSCDRLRSWYSNTMQIHTPIHASWLNQVEIYFSVLQRNVLTPNDFESLEELENTILSFQRDYEKVSRPFEWKFTRDDLKELLSRFDEGQKLAA
jgi:hypothetical protein